MKKRLSEFVAKMRTNTIVRTVLAPGLTFIRKMRHDVYVRSRDSAYIKSLHNKYEGDRCFIIGSGPSLRPEDLDKLAERHEICFSSNRIYKIFSQTKWRPDYYVCIDGDFLFSSIGEIKKCGDFPKILRNDAKKYGRTEKDNIWYACLDWRIQTDYYGRKPPERISADPSDHVSCFGTVTAVAIELAIYMGFSEIYLLGCDHNYALKADKDGSIHQNTSVSATYFNGADEDKSKAAKSVQCVDFMTESYLVCKKSAEEAQVKIYNATRGGKLEIFERVDFDELMSKAK